jgi:hypothetical protein
LRKKIGLVSKAEMERNLREEVADHLVIAITGEG